MIELPKPEHHYYPIKNFSKIVDLTEEDLWLHAEQGRIKFSIKFNDAEFFFSRESYIDDIDEIDTDNPPEGVKYMESYEGYLQLREDKIKALRKKKKKPIFFKDSRFLLLGDEYQYAECYKRPKLVSEFVVLRKHAEDFLNLINIPNRDLKQSYEYNPPSEKQTTLYRELLKVYINCRVDEGKSTPSFVWDKFKGKIIGNTSILNITEKEVKWQGLNGEEPITKIETVKKKISEWNKHYKNINL